MSTGICLAKVPGRKTSWGTAGGAEQRAGQEERDNIRCRQGGNADPIAIFPEVEARRADKAARAVRGRANMFAHLPPDRPATLNK